MMFCFLRIMLFKYIIFNGIFKILIEVTVVNIIFLLDLRQRLIALFMINLVVIDLIVFLKLFLSVI